MRSLKRNRITIHYSNYLGQQPIYDEEGYRTGEYAPSYTDPVPYKISVSPALGEADLVTFGSNENYDRRMSTCDLDCEINEYSLIWVDSKPPEPHDYLVYRRADSINGITFAIKRVEVTNSEP